MDNPDRNIAPIDQNFFPGSNKHITLAIVGCSTPDEIRVLADAGRQKAPLTAGEKKRWSNLSSRLLKSLLFTGGAFSENREKYCQVNRWIKLCCIH